MQRYAIEATLIQTVETEMSNDQRRKHRASTLAGIVFRDFRNRVDQAATTAGIDEG